MSVRGRGGGGEIEHRTSSFELFGSVVGEYCDLVALGAGAEGAALFLVLLAK
jgi:hypothetical protein